MPIDLSGLPDRQPEEDKPTGGIDLSALPDTREKLLEQRGLTVDTSPDEYAKVRDLSKQTGVPEPVTLRNLPKVEERAHRPDWKTLNAQAPKTSRALAEDVEFFKLANDDIDNLSWWESAVRDIKTGYEAGELTNELGKLGYQEMAGAATPDQRRRIGEIQERMKGLKGSGGFLESASKILGQMVDNFDETTSYGLATGMTAGGAAALAGQAGPQVAVPEEILTVPAATLGGFYAGYAGKSAELSLRIEAGHAYLDMIEQNIEPEIAEGVSIGVGLVNAALETVGLQAVSAPFRKYMSKKVTEELTTMTTGKALTEFGKNYALAWGGEVSTEVLQEITNVLGEEIARQIDPKEMESLMATEAGREQIAERLWGIFEEVGKGMTLLAIPGASINLTSDLARARTAERNQLLMQALGEKAGESKLRERAPDKHREFIDKLTEDGPVDAVYVDARKFTEFFQEQGIDVQQIANELPEGGKTLNEALAVGGDVRIPLGEYVEKLAGTEYHQGLLDHLRFKPEDMSAAEARTWQEEQTDRFSEEAERVLQERGDDTAFQDSANQVHTGVREQIKRSGRFTEDVADKYAALHRAFAVSMADRLGVMPHQVYERFGLSVGGAETAATFSQLTPTQDVVDRWQRLVKRMHPSRPDFAPTVPAPAVLKRVGAANKEVSLPTRVAIDVLQEHPDVPQSVFDNLPALLSDPVYVYKYLETNDNGRRNRWTGKWNVVLDATTDKGEPIVVGIRDGRIHTITPQHDGQTAGAGMRRLQGHVARQLAEGQPVYVRDEATLAGAREADPRQSGKTPLGSNGSRSSITQRADLIEDNGEVFYQDGNKGPTRMAQLNDIGLYSGVEQAVWEMPLPQWKRNKQFKLTPEERARLDELQAQMKTTGTPEYLEWQELNGKLRRFEGLATGEAIWAKLQNMAGVKKEEIEWLGIEEFLLTNPKEKFTREDVAQFVRDNGVEVEETVADDTTPAEVIFEFDWDETIDDDSSNWQHRVEDYEYDFDHGDTDFYFFDMDEWLEDHAQDVIDHYESVLEEEEFAELSEVPPEDVVDTIEAFGHNVKDDMTYAMRDDFIEAAEEAAEREYMENPYVAYRDENTGIEIYGNDDTGFAVNGNWDNMVYSFNEAEIQARDYAYENDLMRSEDDETVARWGEFVMNGDHDNYREVKLTLPDITPTYNNDVHFPDDNIVAFLRVTDRELPTKQLKIATRGIGYDENPADYGLEEIGFEEFINRYMTYESVAVGQRADTGYNLTTLRDDLSRERLRMLFEKDDNKYYRLANSGEQVFLPENTPPPAEEVEAVFTADTPPDFMYVPAYDATWGELVSGDVVPPDHMDPEKDIAQALSNWRGADVADRIRYYSMWREKFVDNVLREAREQNTSNDVSTYFIDEFQSDWHQQGRKEGYSTGKVDAGELDAKAVEIQQGVETDMHAAIDRAIAADKIVGDDTTVSLRVEEAQVLGPPEVRVETVNRGNVIQAMYELLRNGLLHDYRTGVTKELYNITRYILVEETTAEDRGDLIARMEESDRWQDAAKRERYGVPDAPFKGDNWMALGLKRAIVDAVENGYEAIAWADSGVLMDRWSSRYETLYQTQYDKKMPSLVKKLTKTKPEHIQVDNDQGYWIIPITDELRERVKAEGFTLFQSTRAKARGSIQIGDEQAVINLFKNADLSTFLHESGHFFFEAITRFAQDPAAPSDITKDLDTLLSWLGVADRETWYRMSNEERREAHEQFARGFEAYLFEDKAPSLDLRGLFRRFSTWLKNVYRSIQGLDVELTDEVRDVMDRMLATEDQIKEKLVADHYLPMFESADQAGMTTEEWRDYQDLNRQIAGDAGEELQRRSLRDMKWLSNARSKTLKQLQREASAKRKTVRAEVTNEVMRMPLYRARHFLTRGELPGGEALPEGMSAVRLNTEALKDMYGTDEDALWRRLPTGQYGMVSVEGVHPDIVAEWFGFSSGDELVQQLINEPKPNEVIEARTDRLMLERYGDLTDPATLEQMANEALHNEARTRFIHTELRALARRTGTRNVLARAAKDYAETAMSRKKVREVGRSGQYLAAETKAAEASTRALTKGDQEMAAQHKRAQLLNHYFYMASRDATTEVERTVRFFKKFERQGTRKNLDVDYLDQIDRLLERFDLRKGVSLREIDKRASLKEWIESQREMGFEPIIDEQLESDLYRKHYKEMTLEEMRGLRDTIKNIEHLARLKKRLLTQKDNREFAIVAEGIAQSIQDNAKRTRKSEIETRLPQQKAAQFFEGFVASHRKLSSLVREMDGWKDAGPFWETLIRTMNEKGDWEAVQREQATIRLGELFKGIGAGDVLFKHKQFIPAINTSLTKAGRLSVALNWGNETNRQRLMDGYGWNPTQVQAVLDTLNKEDWDFVQGTWDFINEYWEQIADKERRVTGIAPVKVEASPVLTPHGEYKGGYYPVKFDDRQSAKAYADAATEAAEQALRGLYSRATTRRGHTKARTEQKVQREIRLDLGVIFEHVEQVVHDLAWHEWLIDANRILRDKRVQKAIRDHHGFERYKQMQDAVTDIAAGDVPAQNHFDAALNHLRAGVSIAGMGWNLMTALIQPLGLTQSVVRVGPKWVGRGLSRWLRDAASMENTVQWIYSKSDFMRLRGKTLQREINEIRNRISRRNKLSAVGDTYFWMIAKAQMIADVPTWLGAYEKAMAEGFDETTALKLADQAVLDAQGGGQVKDLADIQRGHPALKLWTNFYSYFNTTFNLTAESVGRTNFRSPASIGLLAVDFLMLYTVPAVLGLVMREALRGDEPDEEFWKRAGKEQLSYLLGTMIGLRETSAILNTFGYAGPAGARFFAEAVNTGRQAMQGEIDEPFLKAVNKTAGVVFHYPSGQVQRTVEGTYDLLTGETDRPTAPLLGTPYER